MSGINPQQTSEQPPPRLNERLHSSDGQAPENDRHGRYPAAGSSDPKGQIHLLLTFELFICNDRFALRLALASEPFSLIGGNSMPPEPMVRMLLTGTSSAVLL
jgi:hypothetical protein